MQGRFGKNQMQPHLILGLLCLFLLTASLTGCGSSGPSSFSGSSGSSDKVTGAGSHHDDSVHRTTNRDFLATDAPGTAAETSDNIVIDYSHSDLGYLVVGYTGASDKVKIQITGPDTVTYTYTIVGNDNQALPLTAGSGSYFVTANEHISGDQYAVVCSLDLTAELSDEFSPFLMPNQYVNYTADSQPVQYGITLSDASSNDLDYLENVYNYVIENISYDTAKAESIGYDYVPDIDDTMASGKGICFDYAALMCAMLRSQNIPTKLVVGYSDEAYHAWISVYLEETGWVDNVIEFNGSSWSLMDPTLAAANSSEAVKKYVGDGSHYTVKYEY